MENIKEDGIHNTAVKLAEEIKNLSIYKSFYSDIQKLVSSPNVNKEDFKQTLQQAMKEKGLDTKLRNTVYHWVRTQNKQSKLDPLTSLSKASAQWEKRIHKSLNSMCSDLETSLAKLRPQSEQEDISDKWHELSTYNLDLSKYRPVYAPKDFLEVLLTLSGYVPFTREDEPKWEFAHLPLQVKNLDNLRKEYPEWASGEPLLGAIPECNGASGCGPLGAERAALGARVTALRYAPVDQEFLKRGSPHCLRAGLWAQVLGVEITAQTSKSRGQCHVSRLSITTQNVLSSVLYSSPRDGPSLCQQTAYFNQLKRNVLDVDLMIDKLIFKDVQLTASNDDQYFVFEDLLYQVMLCFSRDGEVLQLLKGSVGNPLTVTIKGKQTSPDSVTVFPPSGIIPFHGFSMYATPFCYLYDEPVQLYYTFRAFYIRYWHRLHYISTHPQGIVSLCLLYERLLEANEPLLWIHFRNIDINPIRVVFKWLMRAFSGHLPPDQLLFLWDAILGYDSLDILPLLAVAILSFRKENIFQVNTIQNVDAVLADLSTISIVPLLQLALMKP